MEASFFIWPTSPSNSSSSHAIQNAIHLPPKAHVVMAGEPSVEIGTRQGEVRVVLWKKQQLVFLLTWDVFFWRCLFLGNFWTWLSHALPHVLPSAARACVSVIVFQVDSFSWSLARCTYLVKTYWQNSLQWMALIYYHEAISTHFKGFCSTSLSSGRNQSRET